MATIRDTAYVEIDAIVTDIRVKDSVKRTQENMTAEETIRYLANAANRR